MLSRTKITQKGRILFGEDFHLQSKIQDYNTVDKLHDETPSHGDAINSYNVQNVWIWNHPTHQNFEHPGLLLAADNNVHSRGHHTARQSRHHSLRR